MRVEPVGTKLLPAFNPISSDASFSGVDFTSVTEINGQLIRPDNINLYTGVATGVIDFQSATGVGTTTFLLWCEQYYGAPFSGYGARHAVLDDDFGSQVTFTASTAKKAEFNLYGQNWWKKNSGFRLVLTASATGNVLTGAAVIVIQ